MSTKKEKCCLVCEDQNLALDCMNADCLCHSQSESIEWEKEITKHLKAVEAEFQMGGLSDGLYGDYAREVAKRSITTAVAKREKELVEEVESEIQKSIADQKEMDRVSGKPGTFVKKPPFDAEVNNAYRSGLYKFLSLLKH